jgi:hypothetical protein
VVTDFLDRREAYPRALRRRALLEEAVAVRHGRRGLLVLADELGLEEPVGEVLMLKFMRLVQAPGDRLLHLHRPHAVLGAVGYRLLGAHQEERLVHLHELGDAFDHLDPQAHEEPPHVHHRRRRDVVAGVPMGKVQGRYREGTGKVQGRYREGTGKVQGRYRDTLET